MAKVLWTVKAKRRLCNALSRRFCQVVCPPTDQAATPPAKALIELLRTPTDILARTFPEAETILVHDHLAGYRPSEDRYVLLVEVFAGDESSTYIVKIGPAEKLRSELENWKLCRPLGMHHDPVFLPVTEGCMADGAAAAGQSLLMSIVYGDAHQLIGVRRIVTLEEAVLRSVRFGVPTVQSIGVVLTELLERLGHMMYGRSFVEDPAERDQYKFYVPHLAESLGRWEKESRLMMVRRAASLAEQGVEQFIDPVEYFHYLGHYVNGPDSQCGNGGQQCRPCPGAFCWLQNSTSVQANAGPGPADLIPRLLRGAAHGDLHGRNVLVGIVRERALWPALFDYEDTGFCNLVAWDFAKLETELKIRAYAEIFAGAREPTSAEHEDSLEDAATEKYENLAFLSAVQRSEVRLSEMTEMCYRLGRWPPVTRKTTPLDRLHSILLELRRLGQVHLGIDRGRPNEWLEEYYFVLACYGVCTSRFPNLTPRQWLAAYLSAGVAAARLSWPREHYPRQRTRLGLDPSPKGPANGLPSRGGDDGSSPAGSNPVAPAGEPTPDGPAQRTKSRASKNRPKQLRQSDDRSRKQ